MLASLGSLTALDLSRNALRRLHSDGLGSALPRALVALEARGNRLAACDEAAFRECRGGLLYLGLAENMIRNARGLGARALDRRAREGGGEGATRRRVDSATRVSAQAISPR